MTWRVNLGVEFCLADSHSISFHCEVFLDILGGVLRSLLGDGFELFFFFLLCVNRPRSFRKSECLEKGKRYSFSCLFCLLSPQLWSQEPWVTERPTQVSCPGLHLVSPTALALHTCNHVLVERKNWRGQGGESCLGAILLWCFSKGKEQKEYTSRLKSKTKPQLCNFEWFLNHQNWHYFLEH